jgi:hypothetical protein
VVKRFVVLAVLVVSALAAPAAASADPTTQANVPISFTTWSQCPEVSSEQVAWEGVMHVTYSYTANPAGGLRELFHGNIHLAGVGLTTGDRYLANGSSNLGENYPVGGGAIVIDVEHFHMIHPGETVSEDDYTSRIHLTREGFVEQEGCS